MSPDLRIGCSGFNYPHWRGPFYPEHLSQRRWFSHYFSVFSCVELNVTFYRLLPARTFEKWHDETPENFVFAVKGSRYITHVKWLVDPEEPLRRFFDGALALREKLAAVLWQLPPHFSLNLERLDNFLRCCRNYPVRHVLEFRHESWATDEVVDLCRRHNAAMCLADAPGFLVHAPLTADFVYIRRHGLEGRYNSCYTREELAADARQIRSFLTGGRDVQIYFNNDYMGYAPKTPRN